MVVSVSAQPYGLSNRVGNTTLRIPFTPPVKGYATTNAFGSLVFSDPVMTVTPPGETNRVFVVEQNGIVAVITNLTAPTRSVFLDIVARVAGGSPTDERGLLGMAFHPGYATNGYFYVYYSTTATTAVPGGTNAAHQRLSRFSVSPGNPDQALPNSEQPILTLFDQAGNHNGGSLHFGPDSYLYLSLGDEGGGDDVYHNSQIIDKDFWAGIIRIDVDNQPGSLAPNPHPAISTGTYSIPADNPFVAVTTWYGSNLVPAKIRTEFYAIGLRNPWRMSFDPVTGWLYCGDVGQNAREEVDVIVKGGNYGWSFREGFIGGPNPTPPGAAPLNPILDYGRGNGTNQGYSVTGGVVYRGSRIPALYGYYIFADYVSGNVWATRYDGTNASPFVRLTGDLGVAGFGTDPSNGDVLLADQSEDTIKRLVFTTLSGQLHAETLAETGAFEDLESLTPSAGFAPYDVNVPFWSDNAIKSRWFYFPTNHAVFFSTINPWSFPTGAVWLKHFELELTNGDPSSRKRLETRLLVRYNSASGQEVYGVTYRWGDSQTNATLVPEEGLDESFLINDGGTVRTQIWHYPGRSECLQCHRRLAGLALGFNIPQLNRDFDYGGIIDNQIRAMSHAGYFTGTVTNLNTLRAMAHATNESVSIEQRARSYLAANCAQCHMPGGSALGNFDARLSPTLTATRLVDGTLVNNSGNPSNRVVAPGSIERSALLTRIASEGSGRMPPLASSVVDAQAITLLSLWITNGLAGYQTFPQWQLSQFGSTNAPDALASADPDGDGANNQTEYLTGSNPIDPTDAWGIDLQENGGEIVLSYPFLINRGIELQSATPLGAGAIWQFLDLPENRPFFSGTNGLKRIPLSPSSSNLFFRARVYEP
jgi:glucose/arabinose dehydrogenase/mono/diheme cytochrome c family protein